MKRFFVGAAATLVMTMGVMTLGMALPLEEASARPRVGVRGNVGGYRYHGNFNRGWNSGYRYRTYRYGTPYYRNYGYRGYSRPYQYRSGVPYVYRYGPYGGYYYYY